MNNISELENKILEDDNCITEVDSSYFFDMDDTEFMRLVKMHELLQVDIV